MDIAAYQTIFAQDVTQQCESLLYKLPFMRVLIYCYEHSPGFIP